MTKETFNEGVKQAEKLIDSYLDARGKTLATAMDESALRVCQFVLDLHDHLEITGVIKHLFKEEK